MAIVCKVELGGVDLYPELPVEYENFPVMDERRMLNGQLRRAHRATKTRITLRLAGADETEFAAWASVSAANTTYTFRNERSQDVTVVVVEWRYPLSRTVPDTEGGLSTAGAGFYDLELVLEQV